jgi:hypothetical protein
VLIHVGDLLPSARGAGAAGPGRGRACAGGLAATGGAALLRATRAGVGGRAALAPAVVAESASPAVDDAAAPSAVLEPASAEPLSVEPASAEPLSAAPEPASPCSIVASCSAVAFASPSRSCMMTES